MKFDINGYQWTFEEVSVKELPNGSDGITLYNERKILVRNDIDEHTKACIFRHELTHAILCCQGRWSQSKFTQEDVCEFIAFAYPTYRMILEQVGFREPIKSEEKE